MTVQLDLQSRVTVDAAQAKPELAGIGKSARDVGDGFRAAAADAKASGNSIAQAVNSALRDVQEANRRQLNDVRATAAGKRGSERQAAMERIEEIRRVAQQEIEEARRAANAVISEARRKEAAERQAADAIRKVQVSGRIGQAQLGMQLNDIATQAASGTSPLIIFAQQANQVGYAMSMMGGAAGRVGAVLTGPWGAAITVAVMGLGLLMRTLGEAGDEMGSLADRFGDDGAEIELAMDGIAGAASELGGVLDDVLDELGEWAVGVGGAMAKALNAVADFTARSNGLLPRAFDKLLLAGTPAGDAIELLKPSQLDAAREAQRQAAAGRRSDRRIAESRGNQLFIDGEVMRFDPFDKNSVRDFTRAAKQAGAEAAREAEQLADKAASEAKRAATSAAREAKRMADEQARLIESLVKIAEAASIQIGKLARGDGSYIGFLGGLDAADKGRETATQRSRETTGIAAAVEQAERGIDYRRAAEEAGRAQADAFRREAVRTAGQIGTLIGGEAARTLEELAAAILSGDGQDLRGSMGTIARPLLAAARTDEFKEAFRPVVKQLRDVFGDTPFADQIGGVFQSVAFGSAVAEIVGKGAKEEKIGAAIGTQAGKAAEAMGWLPPGVGQAIGAAVGTAIGGLFVGEKNGSVTLTGSGGQMVQGAATGTGGTQVKNADILGNNFTNALSSIIDTLGGRVGDYSVSLGQNGKYYRVDTTGQGRTRKKQPGVLAFGEDANAAVQAALADAIRDGAVAGVSPRVQTVLRQYAENLDKAVSEALKVQGLENYLADRENPFASAARDFERQAAERVRIARAYGFDVVEIERINAEERTKLIKDQAEEQLASVKALLDDLKFGSRAEGSVSDQLAALSTERSRLQGLVNGGDVSQIDALASIIQQQIDLSRSAYGSTGQYAADRNDAITTIEQLMAQTEQRVAAASSAAQNLTNDKLTEANTTLDEQTVILERINSGIQQMIAAGGGNSLDLGLLAQYARRAV
jgi:hypothetical protein